MSVSPCPVRRYPLAVLWWGEAAPVSSGTLERFIPPVTHRIMLILVPLYHAHQTVLPQMFPPIVCAMPVLKALFQSSTILFRFTPPRARLFHVLLTALALILTLAHVLLGSLAQWLRSSDLLITPVPATLSNVLPIRMVFTFTAGAHVSLALPAAFLRQRHFLFSPTCVLRRHALRIARVSASRLDACAALDLMDR